MPSELGPGRAGALREALQRIGATWGRPERTAASTSSGNDRTRRPARPGARLLRGGERHLVVAETVVQKRARPRRRSGRTVTAGGCVTLECLDEHRRLAHVTTTPGEQSLPTTERALPVAAVIASASSSNVAAASRLPSAIRIPAR